MHEQSPAIAQSESDIVISQIRYLLEYVLTSFCANDVIVLDPNAQKTLQTELVLYVIEVFEYA